MERTWFKRVLHADTGDVWSHRFFEVPISGPGLANRLVTITGLAVARADPGDDDIPPHDDEEIIYGDIYIYTDYLVIPGRDQYKDILGGNKSLLAATYISLSSIAADDDSDETTIAVNAVDTSVATEGTVVIKVRVAVQGDSTLNTIGYQANILINKAP